MPRNFQKIVVVLIKLVILISVGFILTKREYLYIHCNFTLFIDIPMADTISNLCMLLLLYGQ